MARTTDHGRRPLRPRGGEQGHRRRPRAPRRAALQRRGLGPAVTVHSEFRESSAELRTRAVPMSHLSIELGHLYLEDLLAGPDRLKELFVEAAPWARAAQELQPT